MCWPRNTVNTGTVTTLFILNRRNTTMKTKILSLIFAAALIVPAGTALAAKPTIADSCKKCHTPLPDAVRGKLKTVSQDFKTMQVEVGSLIWIMGYDAATTVQQGEKTGAAEELAALPTDKEILVSFTGSPASPTATAVSVKQPYKMPAEQLIEIEELAELIDTNSTPGGYTLVDSRPADAFLTGHIPTAQSLPYGAFEKMHAEVLPTDKEKLVIFYCGGFT